MEKELRLYKKSLRLQTVFYSVSLILLIVINLRQARQESAAAARRRIAARQP